jgi:hypothetical protein
VCGRVVQRHRAVQAEQSVSREDPDKGERKTEVEHPQAPGGFANRCRQPVHLRTWEFVLEQLPTADAKPREDRQGEDDDPHPPEPLRELAPHEEAAGESL